MNFKTTMVLLVLLVGGGAAVYYTSDRQKNADDDVPKTPETSQYVFDPQPKTADLVRVRWERKDKPAVVFERQPKADDASQMEDWRITEPVNAATQTWMVDNLARTFGDAKSRTRFKPSDAGAISAEAAGLAAPNGVVTLTDKDGKEFKLEIGKQAAMSNDTYARVGGGEVIQRVEKDLIRELDKKLEDFRNKQFFKLTANDAVAVKIEHEGVSYELTRGADGDWVIDQPYKAHAAKDKILALVRSVSSLRVEKFVDDTPADLKRYGLDAPWLRCTVSTEKKQVVKPDEPAEPTTQPTEPIYEIIKNTYAFEIGSFADLDEKKRFVKPADQDWVASISASKADDFIPDPQKLRDAAITRVKSAAATELEITVGEQTAKVTKQDGKWTGAGDLDKLDAAAVADVLEAFEDLTAMSFIDAPEDLSKYGLDTPRAVLKVVASGTVSSVTLRIGNNTPSGRNAYVQIEGQPTVMVIEGEQAERLAVAPLALRSRQIFETGDGRITLFDVTRGEMHYVMNHDGSKWNMTEPAGAKADPSGVVELSNEVANLRAKRVASKGDFEKYGLGEPAVTVRFTTETPAKAAEGDEPQTQPAGPAATEKAEHTLVAAQQDGVSYCRLDDDPYVFQLDDSIFRVLTGELANRQLFDFKAADVTGFAVETTMYSLAIEKQDGKWLFPLDSTVELAQKKVKDWIADLADLRVENYLRWTDGDLNADDFEKAKLTVSITLADKPDIEIKIGPDRRRLARIAAIVGERRVFRLRDADAQKLLRTLDAYLKPSPKKDE